MLDMPQVIDLAEVIALPIESDNRFPECERPCRAKIDGFAERQALASESDGALPKIIGRAECLPRSDGPVERK